MYLVPAHGQGYLQAALLVHGNLEQLHQNPQLLGQHVRNALTFASTSPFTISSTAVTW